MESIVTAGATLQISQGDITNEETEAIVNAANSRLAGGGGVDGAIHRAGGPLIMEECRQIGGCPPGKAVITTAGNLKSKFVIHTVGPIYENGHSQESDLLKNAYLNSLKLASEYALASISFPAISTGVYGYPLAEAAEIALETAVQFSKTGEKPHLIRFILFDSSAYSAFSNALKNLNESRL